jgi:2-aminoadipate transaminase
MTASNHASLRFSARVSRLPGSPIRALLSVARDENTLDLGGGIPCPRLFPNDTLARVAEEVVSCHAESALQYAPTEGLLPLREFIAAQLTRRGLSLSAEQIIITQGSQQAIFAVAQVVASPQLTVAFEQPGYPGARQAFALAEAPLVPLPVTPEGWDLDALTKTRPASAYVVAHHHNPTGRTATTWSKQRLATLAETCGFFLIEDDAYAELGFLGSRLRPMVADAPRYGILVGSFSKTLCPGLRVGFIAAPPTLVAPLVRVLQASSLQPGTLAQHITLGLVETLDWDAHLTRLRTTYAVRQRLLSAHCRTLHLEHDAPDGGFFLWVKTHGPATVVARELAQRGVLGVPESAFRLPTEGTADCHLRLSFTRYEDQDEGRLRRALDGKGVQAEAYPGLKRQQGGAEGLPDRLS